MVAYLIEIQICEVLWEVNVTTFLKNDYLQLVWMGLPKHWGFILKLERSGSSDLLISVAFVWRVDSRESKSDQNLKFLLKLI